ncbi:hypothetical protein GCM10011404_32740 [Sphingomonas prati]|nr:hypothetical protein GCM10011404_32740 [Sphingomonas prati]
MPKQFATTRLFALQSLELLDSDPEPEFDSITSAAQHLFGCKIALVSLVDKDRQWFKAKCGLGEAETPRDVSFCAHAVEADDDLIVPDATLDRRFRDNPLVIGPPYIRMYVGVPLRVSDPSGNLVPIGTLCVIDDTPREPAADQIEHLRGMARVLGALCQLRRNNRENLKLALERNNAVLSAERLSKQLLQAERMAEIGSWRLDLATSKVSWSEQVFKIHGLPASEHPDLDAALEFYPPEDRTRILEAVAACSEHGAPYDLELDFIDAQARHRRVRALGEVEMQNGQAAAIVGVFQDITERYRAERRLHQLAYTDELTQLPGRRWLNDELDRLVSKARISGEPLAVALLDLDHFKQVNDQFGHAAGDDVLRNTASTLRDAPYFTNHFAARLGGDEFVLILRGEDAGQHCAIGLDRLRSDLRQQVRVGDAIVEVSATIGVARATNVLCSRSSLLGSADAALYDAKIVRRGTTKFAA